MADPRERGPRPALHTRRDFLSLASGVVFAPVAASLAAACAPAAPPTPTPTSEAAALRATIAALQGKPTAAPIPAGPTATSSKPAETQNPVVASDKRETLTNATPEDKVARELLLNTMLDFLNGEQNLGPATILSSKSDAAKNFPRSEMLNGYHVYLQTSPLKARWEFTAGDPASNPSTPRIKGQLDMCDISFQDSPLTPPLSNADRANGIKWKGTPTIRFLVRARFVAGNAPRSVSTSSFPDPTIDFTPWKERVFAMSVMLQGGEWKVIPGPFDIGGNINIARYPITDAYSLELARGNCNNGFPIPGCQRVDMPNR